jgi:hypothetical protein
MSERPWNVDSENADALTYWQNIPKPRAKAQLSLGAAVIVPTVKLCQALMRSADPWFGKQPLKNARPNRSAARGAKCRRERLLLARTALRTLRTSHPALPKERPK